jgi:hypothetical protein
MDSSYGGSNSGGSGGIGHRCGIGSGMSEWHSGGGCISVGGMGRCGGGKVSIGVVGSVEGCDGTAVGKPEVIGSIGGGVRRKQVGGISFCCTGSQ